MSLYDEASLIITPNAYKEGKLYAVKPTDGSGDFTWSRAGTKTRVNPSGLIETIGTNVPSIDYTGGGCPSILVEPQRTNLCLQSNSFTSTIWSKIGATVSLPILLSPDGNLNASTLTFNNTIGSRLEQVVSISSIGNYTFSFYARSNSSKVVGIRSGFLASLTVNVTVTNVWQRFTVTQNTSAVGFGFPQIRSIDTSAGSIEIYGMQFEAGSYATSYIPTVASAVTRVADVGTVTTPAGVTEITETFDDGTTNIITSIPVTYQLPNGRIKQVVMI